MKNFLQHTVCPILAAMIWGTAFSAQSICSRFLPAFAINAFRSIVAFVILFAACLVLKIKCGKKKEVILGSLVCGAALFLASNAQQFGIGETSAGKSGFITALYIVLVPVFSWIGFRKKVTPKVWIAVGIAVIGMYFLCVTGKFSIGIADLALLFCALMFAVQIMGIDYYSVRVHPVVLSAGQFLVNGILSLLCSAIFETVSPADFTACIRELLYVAVFSSCIAYTLQIVAQKGGNATVVTLLMSLESVFALLGGAVILGERLTGRELIGCALMAAAIVLAQLPERKKENGNSVQEKQYESDPIL